MPTPPATVFHLGLDVDGILADFNGHPDAHGFTRLLVSTSGRDRFERPWAGARNWTYWDDAGYTKDEANAAWEAAQTSPGFWYSLRPYAGVSAFLLPLARAVAMHELRLTFVTTRPGRTAHNQTVEWLADQCDEARVGFELVPQVVTCVNAAAKAAAATVLGLDLYVDDYIPNVQAVQAAGVKTGLYRQPWNAHSPAEMPAVDGLATLGVAIEMARLAHAHA